MALRKKGRIFTIFLLIFTFIVLVRGLFLGTIKLIDDYFNEGKVKVPDLIGFDIKDAGSITESSKLKIFVKGEAFDDHLEKNKIIKQEPRPNSNVKKGRTIDVVISKGKKQNIIPNIKSLKQREAENIILSNNFSLGKKSFVYDDAKEGVVIAQNPPAGKDAREGQFVNLLISKGQKKEHVILPDFTGGNYIKVKDIILLLGLNIGKIKYDYDEQREPGEIMLQDPLPGTRIEKGKDVNLKLNKFKGLRKQNNNTRKSVDFSYTIPDGIIEKELKIILIDDLGIREVHRKKYEPGAEVSFKIYGRGKMKALIYIDNLKIDEAEY